MSEFKDTMELTQQLVGLDRAEQREVMVSTHTPEVKDAKEYLAVWNNDKDHLSCIASSKYRIVQHKDVFENFAKALQKLNINGHGVVANQGDKVFVDFMFDNMPSTRIDDLKAGIITGIRLTNSYDLSMGIYGSMIGKRMVCSNGMILSGVIGTKFHHIHYGKEIDMVALMENFVIKVIDSSKDLQIIVNDAMADSIEWNLLQEYMPKFMKQEKHRNAIMEMLEQIKKENNNITRWDVYNCFTNYASHGSVGEWVTDMLQDKAQKILANKWIKAR
jgi:hypothetical protein